MTEEKIIDGLKQIKEMFDNMKIHDNLYINRPDIYAGVINSMLDLYNKEKEEIEELRKKLKAYEIKKENVAIIMRQYGRTNNIINKFVSKDKIKDKINYYDDKLIELAEKEHNWNKMNKVQQMEHQLLTNRYTNYHNVLSELLEEGEPDAK